MAAIALTAGDTQPTRLTYTDKNRKPIDVTGYAFALTIGYSTPLTRAAVIVDAVNGVIEIPWLTTDLQQGTYQVEMVVTDAAGKTKTHPLGEMVIGKRLV